MGASGGYGIRDREACFYNATASEECKLLES